MCGIVGAVTQRQITNILIEGLRRLEYRGYDSAGLAVIDPTTGQLNFVKTVGKVQALDDAVQKQKIKGTSGVAHTRWATHGKPSTENAHPHISEDNIALVHNGIIENYLELKTELIEKGYVFLSDTDTEVIAHLIQAVISENQTSFLAGVISTIARLHGAYGLAVINKNEPDCIVAARSGSPLVIGVGTGENFIASDPAALAQVTDRFMFMEEGDIAQIKFDSVQIWNDGKIVQREIIHLRHDKDEVLKGRFRHYMLKEIHEQPDVVRNTLAGRISKTHLQEQALGVDVKEVLDKIKCVQIVACGTSNHAGMIAKFWFENVARIPCSVDIASEYRYRNILVPENCLFISISQSGETADTLAALRYAKKLGYRARLSICNVANSSLVRE